jgi:curli biogenesis system outer membrane secretion channel CsgG
MIEVRKNLLIRFGSLAGLILLSSCLATGQSSTQTVAYGCGEPKPRVMVHGFSARDDDVPEGIIHGLTDSLAAAMAETGCYRMIDGTVATMAGGAAAGVGRAGANLYVAGTVTEFTPDASTTDASAAQLPEWLASGALHVASSRIGLSVRLVDARTGEILASSTVSGISSAVGGELTEEEHGYAIAHSTDPGISEAMQMAVDEAVGFLVRQTHGSQIAAVN